MSAVYDRQDEIAYNFEHAKRVVGKAVHPHALGRLFELYPDVKIDVRHEREAVYLAGRRLDEHSNYARVTTRITLWLDGERGSDRFVWAQAQCHPNDNWDRRAGIKLAFDRVLKQARKTHRAEAWERAQVDNARRFISPRTPKLSGRGGRAGAIERITQPRSQTAF